MRWERDEAPCLLLVLIGTDHEGYYLSSPEHITGLLLFLINGVKWIFIKLTEKIPISYTIWMFS
jgi:hypothetical protein